MAFGMGTSSYISRMMGAGNYEEASRATTTTLFTAMGFVAVFSVVCSLFLSPIIDLFGATATAKPYAMDYARWILVSAPFTAATVCLSHSLRGEGSSSYAMIGTVSGCVLNVALDPIFINVLQMGVAGAAIATGISKIFSMIILMMPYIQKKSMLTISMNMFTPKKFLYAEIARMGIPTFLRSSMMTIASVVTNNMARGFGDVALSAISVANKCMRFVGSGIMGFGQGFQPVAGFSWGAKKYDRIYKAFGITSAMGAGGSIVLGAAMFFLSGNLLGLFTKDPEVIRIGSILIRTQCAVLPMHTWIMIATGLFTALGKPVESAILGLSRQLLALIPSVVILTKVFGIMGLAHAQAVSDLVSFTIALCFVIPMLKKLRQLQKEAEKTETAA